MRALICGSHSLLPQLGPPYHVILDTNFINFSIQNKLDPIKASMDCLFAKCTIYITDCVMAELEKLGQKYRVALRIAKDPRFERSLPPTPYLPPHLFRTSLATPGCRNRPLSSLCTRDMPAPCADSLTSTHMYTCTQRRGAREHMPVRAPALR